MSAGGGYWGTGYKAPAPPAPPPRTSPTGSVVTPGGPTYGPQGNRINAPTTAQPAGPTYGPQGNRINIPTTPGVTPAGGPPAQPNGGVQRADGPPAQPTPPPQLAGGQAYGDPLAPAAPPPEQDGVLSGPGYLEDFYKQYGLDLMGTPSASEDLYSQGAAGSNPFYDNAQKEAIKSINDQAAARGNANSSFTMNRIGTTVADLRGQQAHELGQLAGQADRGRTDRYDLSSRMAGGAQDATEDRVMKGVNAYTDISDKQADQVFNFYNAAGGEMSKAEFEAITADLKKAGLSAAEIENLAKAGGEVLSIAAKAYGSGGTGGGGGGAPALF